MAGSGDTDVEKKSVHVHMVLAPSEVQAIDDWSFENKVRGRTEAVRRLVQFALMFDDRAEGMLALAQDISGRVPPLLEIDDEAARANAADEIVLLAIELASDVRMLGRSRNLLADGEKTISFERVEEAREKLKAARAKRVAAADEVKTNMKTELEK